MLSDFEGVDEHTHRHLSGIAAHNDLVLVFVHDPLALAIDSSDRITVGDGQLQAQLDLGDSRVHESLTGFNRERLARLEDWQTRIRLSLMPLSAGSDTVTQIRALLGQRARRERIR